MQKEHGSSCGISLRSRCLVIGYFCLFASLVNVISHVVVVSIMTRGFVCDINEESIQMINWTWLEPFMFIVNMGTHGFYPYPLLLRPYAEAFENEPLGLELKCNTSLSHVSGANILYFFINTSWFIFVLSYIVAIYKKKVTPIRMFYLWTSLKIGVQILFLAYQPGSIKFSNDAVGFLERSGFANLLDIVLGCICIKIIRRYANQLALEQVVWIVKQPPTYEESINNSHPEEKKEAIINIDTKPEVATSSI
ncbi:unnamed protein product [Pieris brassicae]|uniref:Uncharacterized protein n=1 Tax=Pieris brassicae TaxID=7116 RepID=A0A9P0TGI7_PIEBR|nr:unnamed protein product [Pieris brassicae]